MAELRGFGAINAELSERGGTLLAISVDRPEDSLRVVQKNKLPFSILSDRAGTAMKAYGVAHPGGGPKGEDIALPAHFLIERGGRIAWHFIATRVNERADPQAVSAEIERLPK